MVATMVLWLVVVVAVVGCGCYNGGKGGGGGGGCEMGGWICMVAGDAGLWKRDIEEKELEKERGKIKKIIKNDKEKIFK